MKKSARVGIWNKSKGRALIYCVMCAFILAWLVWKSPTPGTLLLDPDDGHQLAGAMQILRGGHPFIDFRSTYGPLTFYASALAQLISGHRIIGEILLGLTGYFIAYIVLFGMLHKISNRIYIAVGCTLLAVLLMPRFYKYYVVLGPMLTLAGTWLYIERPGRKALWLIAASTAFAGLYRFDFGVYCLLCGGVGIAASHWGERLRAIARHEIGLLFSVAACASPWLLWAFLKGGLLRYFRDTLSGILYQRTGMSLPFPTYHIHDTLFSVQNTEFLTFAFFQLLPAASLILLLHFRQYQDKQLQKKVLCTIVLAQVTLVQSTHRADFGHLLQAIPICYILLAWIFGTLLPHRTGRPRQFLSLTHVGAVLFAIPLIFPLSIVMADTTASYIPNTTPASALQNYKEYNQTPGHFLQTVKRDDPSYWYAEAMLYVRAHSKPRQRLLAIPYLASFYYFTNRSFGGGQMLLAPGYFSLPADQNMMVARMAREDIPLIVEIPDGGYDGRADRTMNEFSTIVTNYIKRHYIKVAQYGPAWIVARRDIADTLTNKTATCEQAVP